MGYGEVEAWNLERNALGEGGSKKLGGKRDNRNHVFCMENGGKETVNVVRESNGERQSADMLTSARAPRKQS